MATTLFDEARKRLRDAAMHLDVHPDVIEKLNYPKETLAATLREILQVAPETLVIFITGYATVDSSVEAIATYGRTAREHGCGFFQSPKSRAAAGLQELIRPEQVTAIIASNDDAKIKAGSGHAPASSARRRCPRPS